MVVAFREGSTNHSPPAHFCCLLVLVEISSHEPISLFLPGSVHSSSASWDDCERSFPDQLRVSAARFLGRFPHYAWTAQSSHSDFVGLGVYACLDITCLPLFWQNGRGLLRATGVTRGWNGHRIRVSTKVNPGEENDRSASAGNGTRDLSITSPAVV